MDKKSFEEMHETQNDHWWFRGKRKILSKIISSLTLPANADILEIGCGTGGNLKMLSDYGHVQALEIDDYARECANDIDKNVDVYKGWLPDGLHGIKDKRFDLICMFDVLEHIKDDKCALLALKKHINKGGFLFITVPAYQWMYSEHDRRLGHFRRYAKKELMRLFLDSGYKIYYATYINTMLFPAMAVSRILSKNTKTDKGVKTPSKPINQLLYYTFSCETQWIPKCSNPFGGSVLFVAKADAY